MRVVAAAALCLAATLAAARAAPDPERWLIDPDASSLTFRYSVDGEPQSGVFERFSGGGMFDAAAPEAATLDLTIEAGSLDLGDPLFNAVATSPEWFDTARHPEARYRLTHLEPLGGDRWEATGDLEIRATRRAVAAPITLEISDGEAHAVGAVSVDRGDFGVGVGITPLFVDIGEAVSVQFDIVARRVE
jgi:polyisoprenoid-binding protein YceI